MNEKTFLPHENLEMGSTRGLTGAREGRRVDAIRTTSATFDNPVWQLLEELEEPRPYKLSDFAPMAFIPDIHDSLLKKKM